MQSQKKNKIPSKYHPFAKDLPVAALYGGRQITRPLFDKERHSQIIRYSPKVLKSFPLADLKAKGLRALKRVKRIHTIQDVSRVSSKHQWRLILQNKFKSVLVYKHRYLQEWQSLEKYKAFLNISQVLLKEKSLKKRLLKYLPGMVNLRCLNTEVDNWTTYSTFLEELNSMPKMLCTLERFKIAWSLSAIEENKIPFSCLTKYPNVGKYLTHLDITGIEEDKFLETFKQLPKYCQNLVYLRTVFAERSKKSHCGYLRLTKEFKKLEGIQIHLEDVGSFIRNFDLPSSMKDVSINFGDSSTWADAYEGIFHERVDSFPASLKDYLLDREIMSDFFEKWKDLGNLTSLWLGAKHESGERNFVEAFVKLILRNVPNLVNIQLDIEQILGDNFGYGANKSDYAHYKRRSISLTEYFKACQSYSDKLEKMELTLPWKYPLTCPSAEDLSFPRLTLLKVVNNIIADTSGLENLFKILKKPALEEPFKDEKDVVQVILDRIIVTSNENLLGLFEALQKCPRNAKIELTVEVKKMSFETFGQVFEEFIEKSKKVPATQNVALTVKIPQKIFEKGHETLMFLLEVFGKVFFSELYESQMEQDSEDDDDEDDEDDYGSGDEDEDDEDFDEEEGEEDEDE